MSDYLAGLDREELRAAYAQAAGDARFLGDVTEVQRDFRGSDEDPELRVP